MEVSGRKLADILCEPCHEDGQTLLAVGFCVDCCEYLCSMCHKHHCIPRPCRNHVLLDKETMPRTKTDSMTTEITDTGDKCSKHRGEIIKFYCRFHRTLGCGSCMMLNHRKCDKIVSIVEEYEKLEKEMKEFGLQIDKNYKTKDQNSFEIDNIHSKADKDIKLFMSKIKQYFESLENRTITDAYNLKDKDEKKMKNISDTCMTLRNDVQSLTSDLFKLHQTQQNKKLFTKMEEARDQMKTIAKQIDEMNKDNKVEKYTFVPEKQIQDMIGNVSALGILNTELKPHPNYQTEMQKTSDEEGSLSAKTSKIQNHIATTAHLQTTKPDTNQTSSSQSTSIPKVSISCKSTQETFKPRQVSVVSDINVQSSTDKEPPRVTGIAILSDDQFLVTDDNNNVVKLVNTKQNKIVTEIKLYSRPCDITIVNNNLVGVTMPDDNQIQLLRVSNYFYSKLSQGQSINVNGSCQGIVHTDGTLIVTYKYPVKIEIISMCGNVLKVIDKGPDGESLFVNPNYIAISPDNTHVYISDNDDFSVTCMTLDGKVKGVYKDDDLCRPCGLTVDKSGTVHLGCAWAPNYMYQISADCSQGQKLQGSKIWNHRSSIAYCHKMDKLYVDIGHNLIQVYQLE